MPRFPLIDPSSATGKAKDLMASLQTKLGMVPNIARAMAGAPAVLDGYLSFSGALSKGTLTPKIREQIALTVAEVNGCEYCLAAHSAIGKMAGLSSEEILDSRRGTAVDSRTEAILRFANQVVERQGRVTDADIQAARQVGWDDQALVEVVGNVALNIFTNYFNHVAQTVVDFPEAQPLSHDEACASIPGCDPTRS